METVGLVGVGKIGLPIAENLIKSGYRVLGYRRSSLAEFEKIGGVTARSPADIGAQADVVFSCLPSSQALEDVVQGSTGLIKSARPGQIIVELGSHPVPEKERHVAPLAAKGATFLDGEVSGTPGMVSARKAVIYLAGDKEACAKAERFVRGFADSCLYFGPFGAASRVKLVNNLLVAIHIAATARLLTPPANRPMPITIVAPPCGARSMAFGGPTPSKPGVLSARSNCVVLGCNPMSTVSGRRRNVSVRR